MATIGITHDSDRAALIFAKHDLDRLSQRAELIYLGSSWTGPLPNALATCDILLGGWGMPRLTDTFLHAAPRLQAVCYAAGSVKYFTTPEAYARNLRITTAMAANAEPVANVTAALITLASKNWFAAQDTIRRHGREGWDLSRDHFNQCRTHDPRHEGPLLSTEDLAVGLLGFGAIARLVAQRLTFLKPRLYVYDPHVSDDTLRQYGAQRATSTHDLAQMSDIISLHAPDIPATHHVCNAAFFAAMRPGTSFINTARGRLVDEAALIAALESGRIQAFLDVTHPEPPAAESPLYRLPNCWLTPHRAGSHGREVHRMGRLAIDEALRVLDGQAPLHPVTQAMLATMA